MEKAVHVEREGEHIIGIIISVEKSCFASLEKDYYFSFSAPISRPFPKNIIEKNMGVSIADLIDTCAIDSTLMGHDLEILKLKMRLLLKDLGWNVCEFGAR